MRGGEKEMKKKNEEKQEKIYLDRQQNIVVVAAFQIQYLRDHWEIELSK